MRKLCAPRVFCSAIFLFALSVVLTSLSFAQSQEAASSTPAAPRMYDASKETVVSGTISEVAARPKAGLPLGLHLMVSTAQGQVDVHLGPYLGRIAEQKGLVAGASIQATGVSWHFGGGDVFLARTVTVGKETITIRNQNGLPVRPMPAGGRTARGMQPTGGL